MARLAVCWLIACLLLVGCGRSGPSDPKASFESYAKSLFPNIKREFEALRGRNIGRLQIDDAYEIDVKRTDSLVSPYVGTLVVKGRSSQDGAEHRYMQRLQFARQDNRWVLKGGECSVNSMDRLGTPASDSGQYLDYDAVEKAVGATQQ